MSEKAEILQKLAGHRRGLRATVDVAEADARRHTTASELTLAGILKHVVYGEGMWIDFVVDGVKVDDLERHAASFHPGPEETVAVLLERYEAVARRTEAVVAGLPTLDVRHPLPEAPWYESTSMSARQVLIHILAETAHHTGHADIIRESLDGHRG